MSGNLKTVAVSEETMSRLRLSARESQRDEREVVEQAVVEYLDRQALELDALEDGLTSTAALGLISHDAMKAWLTSWGEDDELPPPEADLSRLTK